MPLLLLLCWLLQRADGVQARARAEVNLHRAVALALAERGLVASEREVFFISAEPSLEGTTVVHPRALVRAAHKGEPADIFLLETRVSPEGHLIEVARVYNLSDTSAADERTLVVSGDRAAWAISQDHAVTSVQYADFRGEPPPAGRGWTRLQQIQNALTNYQDTGQLAGIGRRSFKLEHAADKLGLRFSAEALFIDADSRTLRIPTEPFGARVELEFVKEQTPTKARPGNVATWLVDRVRAVPWFGDDRMQWVKAVAFDGVDEFQQIVGTVTGDDGSSAVQEELGTLFTAPTAEATDPETGWPPAAMVPMLEPPLKGEGKWVSLDKDPFIQRQPATPAPFVFSFIRTDRSRAYSQIFITMWDPRQVELHAMSGTVEPKSPTGEAGPGLVPRKPEVLRRFVAAFNGGFQTVHGEFGMMAERVLYLPPKPYAATVAELSDGSTGFGTWPEQQPEVPDNFVSLRQNMTPLIVDDEINPYKRFWWGGVPPGWKEESRTVRSGLCMTREGFVGYFYGSSVDPDVLALAMQRARCTYGMHLDMNPGHTGLEFYRAAPLGKLPALGRPLNENFEARGLIPGIDGWEFMGRRMIKLMALMNFPRYINPEARDFFYLTLRDLLPGAALPGLVKPAEPSEGVWRVMGLPQHGWPYAVATTSFRPDPARPDARAGVIRLDPKFLRVAESREVEDGSAQRVFELRAPLAPSVGRASLWHEAGKQFVIAEQAPSAHASRITGGFTREQPGAQNAISALGIDGAGMLVYVRLTAGARPSGDAAILGGLLTHLGCEKALFFPRPLGVVLGDKTDSNESAPAGAQPPVGEAVVLARAAGPGARRILTDTPIVPPKHWAPMQQKRLIAH